MASMFDLVSFNARGLGCDKKRKKVFTMLKKQTSYNAVFLFKKAIAKGMLRNYGKSNGWKNILQSWNHKFQRSLYRTKKEFRI